MSIINARTRTLALAIVSALSLTACLGDGSKAASARRRTDRRRPSPATADQSADQCAEPGAEDFRHAADLGQDQPAVHLPAIRLRPGWRHNHVRRLQQARLGFIRHQERQARRHSVQLVDRHLQGHHDRRLRRQEQQPAPTVRHHRGIDGHDRLGHAELATPDRERRRLTAHQSGGLRDPLWQPVRRPQNGSADQQPRHHDLGDRRPRAGDVVFHRQRLHLDGHREHAVGRGIEDRT